MFAGRNVIFQVSEAKSSSPFVFAILDDSDRNARGVVAMNFETAALILACFSRASFCCANGSKRQEAAEQSEHNGEDLLLRKNRHGVRIEVETDS